MVHVIVAYSADAVDNKAPACVVHRNTLPFFRFIKPGPIMKAGSDFKIPSITGFPTGS